MMVEHSDVWKARSFADSVLMASWIDNVFCFGRTPEDSVSVMTEAEHHLAKVWGLHFKASSKMVLLPHGHSSVELPVEWPVFTNVLVLGHLLNTSGSSASCVHKTLRSALVLFLGEHHGQTA